MKKERTAVRTPDSLITNNPDLEFKSIADEMYREYRFPDGYKIRLEAPVVLNVSASGGHRVLTSDGVSHYIPAGWRHLIWESKPGAVRFNF